MLFHPDGCVIANIRTQTFRVIFARKCEHTKIVGVAMDVTAESLESARNYAEKWINLPQMSVYRVYAIDPATAIGPNLTGIEG